VVHLALVRPVRFVDGARPLWIIGQNGWQPLLVLWGPLWMGAARYVLWARPLWIGPAVNRVVGPASMDWRSRYLCCGPAHYGLLALPLLVLWARPLRTLFGGYGPQCVISPGRRASSVSGRR